MNFNRSRQYLHDHINPIVLKEMRQAVRSRSMSAIFLLTLTGLLLAMGGFVLSGADPTAATSDRTLELGKEAFAMLLWIFVSISIFFVPIYTGMRMQREQAKADIDLFFVTALSPMAFIRGKILSGMLVAGLITCACLPFMTFTYFLRGVDLPSIFITLATAYIIIVTLTQFTLFIATLSRQKALRQLFNLISGVAILSSYLLLMYFANRMADSGIGSRIGYLTFWSAVAFFLILVLLANSLFYIAAVTAVSPQTANRALALRIFFTCVIGLSGLLSSISTHFRLDLLSNDAWLSWCTAILCGGMIVSVCERDKLNLRVAHMIPKSRAKRFVSFFFFSGSAGGIAWILIVLLPCTVALHYLQRHSFSGTPVVCAGLLLYIYAYSISGLLLRRSLLHRWIRPLYTFTVIAALFAVLHLLPIIVLFLFSDNFADQMKHTLLYGNIFHFIDKHNGPHLVFAAGWALLASLANVPWFLKQVKNFKPIDERHL